MTTKDKTKPAEPSVKDLIKRATAPTNTVYIHLGADLALLRALESAEAELLEAKRPATSLAGPPPTGEIEDRIAALVAELAAFHVPFVLKGMGRLKWNAFVAAHPPRMVEGDVMDPRDRGVGVNTDTFYPELVRVSTVSPVLDDEDWLALLGDDENEGLLTGPQFLQLSDAAYELSRQKISLPFSLAASLTSRDSASE